MLTVEEMITKKREYGFSYEYIAEKSGVPVSTVQKIFSKKTPTPRRVTLAALSKAFYTGSSDSSFDERSFSSYSGCNFVCDSDYELEAGGYIKNRVAETSGEYGAFDGTGALHAAQDNSKTIDDYIKLPEGTRVELIDGVFYDMVSPTSVHQRLVFSISMILGNFIKANNGKCIPFSAPMDVQLDSDDKTVVQPDIFVVCDRRQITKTRIVGAPDLVIEILSESNWYNDVFIKCRKYEKAGVREYWIVFPEQQKVQVYNFEKGSRYKEYTFRDKVPVSIWDGRCQVDFSEVYKDVFGG